MSWHDENLARMEALQREIEQLPHPSEPDAADELTVARSAYEIALAIRDVGAQLVPQKREKTGRAKFIS